MLKVRKEESEKVERTASEATDLEERTKEKDEGAIEIIKI